MRVYLDTCLLKRPFDDQTQPRVWLETMAAALIMAFVRQGLVDLVSSSVLEYECSRDPSAKRREVAKQWLGRAVVYRQVTREIEDRAAELEAAGMAALDALHVAAAESAEADFLVTCDDGLLRRRGCAKVRVVGPLEFLTLVRGGS